MLKRCNCCFSILWIRWVACQLFHSRTCAVCHCQTEWYQSVHQSSWYFVSRVINRTRVLSYYMLIVSDQVSCQRIMQ